MNQFDNVMGCFPMPIQMQMDNLDDEIRGQIEEIRVYKGKKVRLITGKGEIALKGVLEGGDLTAILNNLMKFSYYAYEEDLAKGFITIDGGHRVGICGKAVVNNGQVVLLKEISSLNIRCSKEVTGCSDPIMRLILPPGGGINNTLIVSPPGCGKTTLLRDIARNIGIRGYKVGICDERSEIAGMYGGISSYDFGTKTDVLDGCPKASGVYMLIRSMSPHVIITDEIGNPEDVRAASACINSGVAVITSIHGNDLADLKNSQIYELIERKIFNIIIFLANVPKVGTVREVLRG